MPTSPVLAATIVFTGLILHYQTDPSTNEKRAVLVDARPSHDPVLVVADAQRDGEHSGTWTFTQVGSRRRYTLSGRLRVVGASGNVSQTSRFEDAVPRLRDTLTALDDVSSAVRNGSAPVAAEAVAFLEYSGGLLDVPACHRAAASYSPPLAGGPRCVAKEVNLSLSTSASWTIQDIDDPGRTITFKRNAIVQVKNDPAPTDRGQHQKHYAQLLLGGSAVADVTESDLECSP